jgi:hypothetical protein
VLYGHRHLRFQCRAQVDDITAGGDGNGEPSAVIGMGPDAPQNQGTPAQTGKRATKCAKCTLRDSAEVCADETQKSLSRVIAIGVRFWSKRAGPEIRTRLTSNG